MDQENLHENGQKSVDEGASSFSLNDDRRLRTLSPGALVVRRFLRNRVAVTGLVILVVMFIFSFIGGAVTPYREDQIFYRTTGQRKQYAAVKENTEFRYVVRDKNSFPTVAQAKFVIARKTHQDTFEAKGTVYRLEDYGEDFCGIFAEDGGTLLAFATYDVVSSSTEAVLPFELQFEILRALHEGQPSFDYEGESYRVSEDGGVTKGDEEIGYASRYIVQAVMNDVFLSRSFKEELISQIQAEDMNFVFTDEDGTEAEYTITYDAASRSWKVLQTVETKVFDTYSAPSRAHWLGTDKNGMDMLTRLMYGGRVSLYIGFIVVFIEAALGVILGGVSGYFGGFIDNLIMRIVDIFYCIPSMPVIIILGAAMDAMRVDPQIRMLYLMLILGFLGWPGIARLVRGQILSLREQEFMTAAEATGIRASRRIFRHLIPNVIPQLIVSMTMSLGTTIIMEATLSFLGLGVKFPFASWVNIINDVNDTYVLTNFLFIWIPAGVCLLATVLAFNLVGDGLRDAFDPKMKR